MAGKPKSKELKEKRGEISRFRSRVRSVLWNADSTRKIYEHWEALVNQLREDNKDWTKDNCIIQASKEYPVLHKLFEIFDVKAYDPSPWTHGNVVHKVDRKREDSEEDTEVECLDEELSYRDQLRWAMEKAGEYLSLNSHPTHCPCWGAYYLYRQAIENPKEFMTKVGQAEQKDDLEAEAAARNKKRSHAKVDEINDLLSLFDDAIAADVTPTPEDE